MSTGSSEDRRRRRRRADLDDELEEGECTPGYHSSSDTDYYNRDAALSGESDSDETINDLDATASSAAATHNRKGNASGSSASANHNGGARAYSVSADHYGSARPSFAAANHYGRASASPAAAAPVIACRVCVKEFGSKKAVCRHMKIHAQEALQGSSKGNWKDKKVKMRSLVVPWSWGVTGRRGRGCSGLGTSMDIVEDSPNAEPDHSVMDAVPAEPKLVHQTTPMAFTMPENMSSASMLRVCKKPRTSLSAESSSKKPIHNDDMDIAEAGASPNPIPPTEPVVHQQPASPPARNQARLVQHNPAVSPPSGRQNPNGYRCADPDCRMWFRTHQALGGHVTGHAAHKNNKRAEPEERHPCKECPAEFATGMELGGHMRKHWKGDPIVPKKKLRLNLIQPPPQPAHVATGPAVHRPADFHVDDLTLSLRIKAESQSLAPAMDAAQPAPAAAAEETPEPAPGTQVTGRVILFGVDIVLGVQTPPAQEDSPATKDPSASTGGEQQ